MQLDYTLEPTHLRAYVREVDRRLNATANSSVASREIVPVVFALAGVGLFATLTWGILAFQGAPLTVLVLFLGAAAGACLVLGALWIRYFGNQATMFRAGGPVLSPHRMVLTGDGLRIAGTQFETFYRWPAFQDITVHDEIIVTWLEPGVGVVVPRSAFPDQTAQTGFVELLRSRIFAAKLPRAGSFA